MAVEESSNLHNTNTGMSTQAEQEATEPGLEGKQLAPQAFEVQGLQLALWNLGSWFGALGCLAPWS